ncbi:MAG: hypothetical protein KBD24_02160 [Candidatus Pacebacteria bacterium]|nr:hypothetical protein [Candidatus Paceibacterota bacterium]
MERGSWNRKNAHGVRISVADRVRELRAVGGMIGYRYVWLLRTHQSTRRMVREGPHKFCYLDPHDHDKAVMRNINGFEFLLDLRWCARHKIILARV